MTKTGTARWGMVSRPVPRYSPLWQLTIARVREFYRQPEAIFWVYAFPLLLAIALGIAFRDKPTGKIVIDVQDGEGAMALADHAVARRRPLQSRGSTAPPTRRSAWSVA